MEASSTEKDGRDDDTAAPEWATRTRARPHTSRRPARTAATRPSRCLRLWLPELSRLPRAGPDQRVRHRVTRTGNPHYLLGFTSVLALVFGYIARKQIRERGESGAGLAVAGIVLGWVGVGLWGIFLIFVILGFVFGGY